MASGGDGTLAFARTVDMYIFASLFRYYEFNLDILDIIDIFYKYGVSKCVKRP